jgi:hypothetical protein
MFARIGVMRALNRGHVLEFNPDRKPALGPPQAEARYVMDIYDGAGRFSPLGPLGIA